MRPPSLAAPQPVGQVSRYPPITVICISDMQFWIEHIAIPFLVPMAKFAQNHAMSDVRHRFPKIGLSNLSCFESFEVIAKEQQSMSLISRNFRNLLRQAFWRSTATAVLLCAASEVPIARAQDSVFDPANFAWQAGAMAHAQRMRAFRDTDSGQQQTPPVIPQVEIDPNPSGFLGTLQPGGPTQTSQNAFFANLGTNQRTCFTSISRKPAGVSARPAYRVGLPQAMAMIRSSGSSTEPRAPQQMCPASRRSSELIVSC